MDLYLYFYESMKTVITLDKFEHRGGTQIGIRFAYDGAVKNFVKGFRDVKWTQTHKCFYVGHSQNTLSRLFNYLKDGGYYVDYDAFRNAPKPKRAKQHRARPNAKMLYQELPPDLKDLLKGYAKYLRGKRLSQSTVSSYGHFVLRFLALSKHMAPNSWNKRTIETFMEEVMAKEDYSISSHRQCVSALKHFTQYCNMASFDASDFERPKKSKLLPTVLSREEIIDLIQATKNLKHRAIIGLLYSGGLRIGELLRLQLKDIDIDRSQIHIKNSKGRKDRTVAMSEVVKPLLFNYIHTYKPKHYFVEGQAGRQYNGSSVRNFLRKACKAAGITKAVTPHTLRHSYATHMLENGVDVRHIQELLGHSKPETTMIYTHVAQKDLMQIRNPLDVAVEHITKTAKGEQKVLLSRNIKR